ncbi:MAG TPA: hypothetical protein VK137_10870, partial [Planctomycetaceae bacterium]|nr:hypothetical protein [Planctomycetaceae bacterium]
MLLDHARALKATLLGNLLTEISSAAVVRTLAIRAQAVSAESEAMRSIAVGIAQSKKQHQLAVRVQRRALLNHPLLDRIRKQAKGEVDVRYVGRIGKLETPATLQKRRRPLVIGCSIGHHKITAGTLGCFVQSRTTNATLILSNNHVLANENKAKAGDAILQPGRFDGGTNPADIVATLQKFIRLKPSRTNFVDAAVAQPSADIHFNQKKLGGFGNLKGIGPDFLDEGTNVRKVGRTTGETKGRVTAFELDNVVVGYDIGNLRFDNQVEIEGAGTSAFSDGGDSGSLIVNEDNL